MSRTARVFITTVIAIGLVTAAAAIRNWQCDNPGQFASYLLLAVIASTRKVRVPGITGTYSLNFVFILLGFSSLSFAETVTIGCASTVAQCMWNTTRLPSLTQVAFNVGNVAVSIAVSYFTAHQLTQRGTVAATVIALAFAASIFFIVNTILVSGAITLAERQHFRRVWAQWILSSVPLYIAGTGVAIVIAATNYEFGWKLPLLCLPLPYLLWLYYHLNMNCDTWPGERPVE